MALKPTTSTESLSCFHECEVLFSEVLSSAYRPKAIVLEPLTTSVTLPNFAANACTSPVMANAPELGTYTRYVVGLPMHSPAVNQQMCVIMRMGPYVLPSVLTHCADTAPVVALNTHTALSKSRGMPVAAGQLGVARHQRHAKLLGQREVGGVIGTQAVPEFPDAADQGAVRDRKSTRLNSSHSGESRMPSSA